MRSRFHIVLLMLSGLVVSGCASSTLQTRDWSESRQLVLVTTADWDATDGVLRRYERGAHGWQPVGDTTPVTVGRAGSAWGQGLHAPQPTGPQKREGDGRAPAGVFGIGTAFGYGDAASTALPYRAMTASDYCIDVSDSPLYDRIVDARQVGQAAVAGSTEPMRRDLHADGDSRYKLGFVIEHNPIHRAGAGSCIFANLWKAPGEATAGCTAMAEPAMQQLLGWLDPERKPVFVLMPVAELERLRRPWELPHVPAN
ncbi:L,D-transpeptidase [Lysobacter cavernae]|uniref:L,D-transpeptidase n=1 Tax=Lysobacter cavernae TaxID=1685901 RepID=A0ABV7RS14_9GAMM